MRNLRRTALSLVLAVALLAAMAVPALAANPTVSITVRARVVAITNSQDTWDVGIVVTSAEVKWGSSDTYSTLTNIGTVNVDVEIQGADLVASNTTHNWVLADDGTPGDQIYGLKATTTGTYNITVKKTPFNDLVTNLPHTSSHTKEWSMTFYVPTAFNAGDDGAEKSSTVTLVASVAA